MMNKIITLFINVLFFSSCSSFLDANSDTDYVPKDVASLNDLLIGSAYKAIQSQKLDYFLPLLEDDITCRPFIEGNDDSGLSYYYSCFALKPLYTWRPNFIDEMSAMTPYSAPLSENELDLFTKYYTLIAGVNAVLDYADRVTGKEEEINDVKAQALALRGFFYFSLVNIYGAPYHLGKDKPGVPLKLTSNLENKKFPRNTVEEVYIQVINDLSLAESYYNQISEKKNTLRLETSKTMVNLLLSRVYLYMEDWENAAIYAKKVIDQPEFKLLDLNTIPEPSTRKYPNFINNKSPEVIWLFSKSQDLYSMASLSVSCKDTRFGINYNSYFFNSSQGLLDLFKEGDLRKSRYIFQDIWQGKEKEIWTGNPKDTIIYQALGKIGVSTILPDNNNNNYYNSSLQFGRAFRLPEAYLNYSEALAMLGGTDNEQKSKSSLNELRVKRIHPNYYNSIIPFTGKDLVNFIREERRRELCFECHRWFDIRRYNIDIEHTWITDDFPEVVTLKATNKGYSLQLPPRVIQENTSLVQND